MRASLGNVAPATLLAMLVVVGSSLFCASWASGESNDLGSVQRGERLDLSDADRLAGPMRPRPGRCPAGFPKVTLRDGTTVCGPSAQEDERVCAPGEARFPGERSCAPIGRRCADAAGDEVTLRVSSAGEPSGPGAAASFATLADALAVAGETDVIELARGVHVAPSRIDRAVQIRGACGGGSSLVAEAPLEIAARAVSLSDLTLEGGLVILPGAQLSLDGASVTSDETNAVVVQANGELVGSRLVVRSASTAIAVDGLATAELRGATLEGDIALAVSGEGARATLERVSLSSSGRYGLHVSGSAHVRGDRVVVTGRSEEGIHAVGARTELVLRWAFVPAGDGPERVGLHLEGGAHAAIEASRLEAGRDARVVVETGATFEVRDSLVSSDGTGGDGLRALTGARVLLERAQVRGASGRGIDVVGAFLVAHDLSISSPGSARALSTEAALEARGGAQVEVWRARVERPRTRGFIASGQGTSLTLHEVRVLDAQRSECATDMDGCDGTPGGDALVVLDGAALHADRVGLEGSRGCGAVVAGAWSTLELEETRILDNRVGICADGAEPGALRMGAGVVEAGNESSFARPRGARVAFRD